MLVSFKLIIYLVAAFGAVSSGQPAAPTHVVRRYKLPATGINQPLNADRISEALRFCRRNRLDTVRAFFVDMSLHSGKKRFFVYNFSERAVEESGLVCHGMGGGSTCSEPKFSNEKGSNCTSLGKYKTGARSWSQYGINVHYKLHGLEPTNHNAFNRVVVLHSYDPVPDEEIIPDHLPMGWSLGCPVISNRLMRKVDGILRANGRPFLLWVYN